LLKRASVLVMVAAIVASVGGFVGTATVAAAERAAAKVVLIVGPAGGATENYRRLADEAAAEARKFTPNVVKVYSPDATWPAVRQALEGASVVVYLGHGNGWPSRYRDSLYPPTQNGFGLNPHAGAGDTHQYFGEERIAREIELADNAVVIFSHLCYASGNTEPGLPEGTLDMAQQRVDNYAAGFIEAGAAAVIAEAHAGPAYYVRSILAGKGSIDRIWRDAPTYNGNLLQFDSVRSPGFTAQMDPDNETSGFYRSIVLRRDLAAANVLSGAVAGSAAPLPPPEPTLTGLGLEFNRPGLAGPPTMGATTKLTFGLAATDPAALPDDLTVAVRWNLLDGGNAIVVPASEPTAPVGEPAAGAEAAASPTPAPTPPPAATPSTISLVAPEVPGQVVAPVAAVRTEAGVEVPVRVPATPGLYRLVGTIHGGDGVAFDAETQAMLPALIVRVTGPVAAAIQAPDAVFATGGELLEVPVSVTNLGANAWGAPAVESRIGGAEGEPASRATVVVRWVALGDEAAALPETSVVLPPGLAPGMAARVDLQLAAPETTGAYLLLVDVLAPRIGSLVAAGVAPGIVRVNVTGAAATAAP
jgi:hypothetical protein